MMKLTFVLFAVLLAIVPYNSLASPTGAPLESVQQEANVVTDNTLFAGEGFISDIRGKVEKWGEELKKRVNEFLQKVDDRVNQLMQKINDRITEIVGNEATPPECKKLAETIQETARAVIANQTRCVRDVLETGRRYVTNIREIQAEVNTQLQGLREQARECRKEDGKGFKESIKNIVCVNKVGIEAFWVVVKRLPEVTTNATKLRFLVKNLPKTLSECASKNGADTLSENVDALLSGVKQCVREHGEGSKPQPEVTVAPVVEEPTTSATA